MSSRNPSDSERSDKSHVTMETKVCIVCGLEYSTGNILLDTKLRARFERTTLTGEGMCDAHVQSFKEGRVALIEIDPAKSGKPLPNGNMDPEHAYRTGRVFLVWREALNRAVKVPVPADCPLIFVDEDSINKMLPPEVLANVPDEPERSTAGHVAPGSQSIN